MIEFLNFVYELTIFHAFRKLVGSFTPQSDEKRSTTVSSISVNATTV